MRESQMKEAKQQMKEKAKELAKAKVGASKSRLGGAMAVSNRLIMIFPLKIAKNLFFAKEWNEHVLTPSN